jgi:2-polyprenyl-6-methoxyphenol hydroxylase-like FAD-dependent oxidoreductase
MKKLSIGIGGAGIGGLAAGAFLKRAGHEVVVFDYLDRPRPLGSGIILQPVGMRVLEALGLGAPTRALTQPINRLFGKSMPADRVVLDAGYGAHETGHGIHRGALFQMLFDAALNSGVVFESHAEIIARDEQRFVLAGARMSARFDVLIDALGVRSPLSVPGKALSFGALWASLPWPKGGVFNDHALEQRYIAARKMVGVMPIGRLERDAPKQAAFFWSLKGVDHAAWRATPIEQWKEEVRALWPATHVFLEQIDTHDDVVFARYAHRTLASPIARGLAHVGDSYRCASPQLGQGANMALLDAFALAHALARQPNLEIALSEYARMRTLHTWIYQSASFLFTPFYQSDDALFAWFRDRIAAPLSRVPPGPAILAALVAGRIGAPLRAIQGPRDARLIQAEA